jgi:hypothetical protein
VAVSEAERKTAAVAKYHADCLRAIGAQNVGLHDLRATRKAAAACDLGLLADTEEIFSGGSTRIAAPEVPDDPEQRTELETQRLETWERLRELARKAAVESHNKEVTYGALLLEGLLPRTRGVEPVLAPLLMRFSPKEVEAVRKVSAVQAERSMIEGTRDVTDATKRAGGDPLHESPSNTESISVQLEKIFAQLPSWIERW